MTQTKTGSLDGLKQILKSSESVESLIGELENATSEIGACKDNAGEASSLASNLSSELPNHLCDGACDVADNIESYADTAYSEADTAEQAVDDAREGLDGFREGIVNALHFVLEDLDKAAEVQECAKVERSLDVIRDIIKVMS